MIKWFGLFQQLNREFNNLRLNAVSHVPPKQVLSQETLSTLDVPELFSAILQPRNRTRAIFELYQRCKKQPALVQAIYRRPGILPALLFEVMKHTPIEGKRRNIQKASDVVITIAKIFRLIFDDQSVRNQFLATGVLFYMLPYLNDSTSRVEPTSSETDLRKLINLRISVLSVFTYVAQKLALDEIDELLVGPDAQSRVSEIAVGEYQVTIELNNINLYDEVLGMLRELNCVMPMDLPLSLLKRLLECPGVLGRLLNDSNRFAVLTKTLIACLVCVIQFAVRPPLPQVCGMVGSFCGDINLRNKLKPTVLNVLECCNNIAAIEKLRATLSTIVPQCFPLFYILCLYGSDTEVTSYTAVLLKKLDLSVDQITR